MPDEAVDAPAALGRRSICAGIRLVGPHRRAAATTAKSQAHGVSFQELDAAWVQSAGAEADGDAERCIDASARA